MKLLDKTFPLLIMITGEKADEAEIRSMDEHFRKLFGRGERYVLLNVAPKNQTASAKERKAIADWANQPYVHDGIVRCCMGSALVLTSTVARGALTAILWVWRPPVHLEVVPNVEAGIKYCADMAKLAGLVLPGTPEELLRTLRPLLEAAGADC